MNKTGYIILIVVMLGIIGFAIYQTTKSQTDSNSENTSNTSQSISEAPEPADTTTPGAIAILFYGNECPHCKDLNKWLEDNKVKEKVKFDHLEVYDNAENNNLLGEKAKVCEMADDKVGVPFLYDTVNNKCLIGGDKIQDFFKSKL